MNDKEELHKSLKTIDIESKNYVYFSLDTREPSKKLLDAIEKGEAILRGEIPSKGYRNMHDLFEALDSDD